jgi:predicted N-acetyltransferase YhbS
MTFSPRRAGFTPGWRASSSRTSPPDDEDRTLITLAPLDQADTAAVEALLDAAFGSDRHGRTAYRLREGMAAIPQLSFAALDDGVLIGSLQSWPIELAGEDGAAAPIVLVGPVAVRPDRQRDGIGKMLMIEMLRAADAAGEQALLLIGDPEYYDRFFGFTAEATESWEVPGPVERHRLLARLRGGAPLPRAGRLGPRRSTGLLR